MGGREVDGGILWVGTWGLMVLLLGGCGGARWEVISEARPWRDFPRALMKMSATAGCFIVAKETKIIFARSICVCQFVFSGGWVEQGDPGPFINSPWPSS